MQITKLEVENFRLLKEFSMDLEKELSLVIGKNNTGKTSILSVLNKFLNEKNKFSYDDFNIDFKKELEGLIKLADVPEEFLPKGIKLKIFIDYDDKDNLSNVSRVLMDLDPANNKIVLGFEYILTYTEFLKLRNDYNAFDKKEKQKVAEKKIKEVRSLKEFLKQGLDKYFTTQRLSFEYDLTTEKVNEFNYINLDSEKISIKDIISFKYIPARRDVTNKDKDNTLSKQTSSLYSKNEDSEEKAQATEDFIDQLSETDRTLSGIYSDLFKDVLKNVSTFGGVKLNETTIDIISTLQHRDLLEGNTTVVYTHDIDKLPEQYNGLGYMNLISMIFEIEILRQEFKRKKEEKPADINLLVIEEPEAHTHPQMQYVFIKNIKSLLAEGIMREDGINKPLQYIITTHSSHIVADSDFNDIKYLKIEDKNNVVSKNLIDLKKEYDTDTNQYQFLKQYLTISRAEIFFADKAVLIEGDTERILIPTFMRKVDIEEATRLEAEGKVDDFLPLLSQNISTIEVGAYSQIFKKFIEFLGIKSLVLTDIDSVGDLGNKDKKGKPIIEACEVVKGTATSNSAIKHFLGTVDWKDLKNLTAKDRTIKLGSAKLCLCYQQEEDAYHARSFEDAFIHINRAYIAGKKDEFQGLQHRKLFDDGTNNAYVLADSCIKKKTHFALDILYHSNENFSNWNIPEYIKNGLLWLKED
ncbi:ATP-dependent endonuclease [Winogradskyella maritima]|uniref:ATP-dependent endonuclease n=1 Tax=Winogradskyella maritima TaxID=1517766 RepID=A0ABV8ADL3_9FLAO|nr:ATP-dependent endonuclease [Winogradskyella maritima]